MPVGLPVEGVEADRVDDDRHLDALQQFVGDVPLPTAVAVGRGVRDEQPAAADDQPAPGVDPFQRGLVEEPVGVDGVPAAGAEVGAEVSRTDSGSSLSPALPCWGM